MPWFISLVLPLAISIVKQYGIPALEKDFPKLAPLLEELLRVLNGTQNPTMPMQSAGEHYDVLTEAAGIKKE